MARNGKNKNTRRIFIFLTLIFGLTTLILAFCCVLLFSYFSIRMSKVKTDDIVIETESVPSDRIYTQEDVDQLIVSIREEATREEREAILEQMRDMMESGNGTVEMLRYFYPDQVVLLADNQYYFLDIRTDLKMNGYDPELFEFDEAGDLHYHSPEGEESYLRGIDVSKYQGKINWEKVKESGKVDFAILRAGLRGYTEGALLEDETFRANLEGATNAGIPVGLYFFTQATTNAEAVEEANYCLELIGDAKVEMPIYVDVEEVSKDNARTSILTSGERTDFAITFMDTIEKAGYKTGIYGNLKSFMLMLDISRLEDYEKWFADYDLPIYFPYDYTMLQYSESGNVDGISEPVDMNIYFR
ncbi:MAG: glycoside hydrolase family 25 protein [Lachnospiraceae bacterium]|nr:glycoside hydrolase family 25 protein [Lachnospiraceae bacterium]